MSTSGQAGAGVSRLLTLKQAAEMLGVSEPAVIQMLQKERLSGPVFEGRAPKGAGRVTEESAFALRDARSGAPRRGPAAAGPGEPTQGTAGADGYVAELQARVRELEGELGRARRAEVAARAGLLAMKTTADQALATARHERKLNRSLTAEVARLAAILAETQEQTDRVDAAVGGYSETLTGLLVPPDASELDEP